MTLTAVLGSPPTKRKKLADWMASDVEDIHEDDLEVYGQEDQLSTSRIGSYSFEVTPVVSGVQ